MSDAARFRKIPEEIREAIAIAEVENFAEKYAEDLDGNIVYVNRKFAQSLGYTPAEIEGKKLIDIIPSNKAPLLLDLAEYASLPVSQADWIFPSGIKGPVYCYSTLYTSDGTPVGRTVYDGIDIVIRHQSLYDQIKSCLRDYTIDTLRTDALSKLIGTSAAMSHLREQIKAAAKSDSTILVEGETGTGKELVADAIQAESLRKKEPYIKINCAAIPQELFESELMGYAEGAFTGAKRGGKKGKFELANHGTIVLDEINSLSLTAQAKLLRILQQKEIDPIGGDRAIPVDIRVIALSNKPLSEMVAEGTFRMDLYYRLNIFYIRIPPLRERRDDVPALIKQFVILNNKRMNKNITRIESGVYELFKDYAWPGNVRELQNFVERAMVTVWMDVLTASDFRWTPSNTAVLSSSETTISFSACASLKESVQQFEKRIIAKALEENQWNKAKTAKALDIPRQVLYRKIEQYSLERT